MAVSEQTPYIEYIANGVATNYPLEFDCEKKEHLIVLVDDVEPVVGAWSFSNGAVVFNTAPENGKKITIQRNTPFSRTTDYQSYNNSFRPPSINNDFDRVWRKLQELGVADWLLRLYIDRLHGEQNTYIDQKDAQLQQNIDNLKNYVDLKDDELRAYLIEEIRKQGVSIDQLDDYYNHLMQILAQIAVDRGWSASFVSDASGVTQQDINDQIGAKWRNKIGGYLLNDRVTLENGDIVKSTVANNLIDPNVDMMGWKKIDFTKTIRHINSFNSFSDAQLWIQQSNSNFVELESKDYTLASGTQYLNRIFCSKGRAKINIANDVYLTYATSSIDDVLYIDGIDFIITGHRIGQNSNTNNFIYSTNATTYIQKTAHIDNIDVFGLFDTGWVDDVGKTRCENFINFKVSQHSHIANVKHYGLRLFAFITPSNNQATHFDSDVVGFNNETGLYFGSGVWSLGESCGHKTVNTQPQSDYWVGQGVGVLNNGNDTLLNEAQYLNELIVDNIYAKYAVERTVYIQSDNAVVSNITDEMSYAAGHVKKSTILAQNGESSLSKVVAKNITNLGVTLQSYGFLKSSIENVNCERSTNAGARLFVFTNNGELNIGDVNCNNFSQLFLHQTGANSGKVNISNVVAVDCYSDVVPYIFSKQEANNQTIDNLIIENLNLSIDKNVSPSSIFNEAIDLGGDYGVKSLNIKNSNIDISRSLLSYGTGTTSITLDNLTLNVRTLDTVAAIFANMLLGSLAPLSASTFNIDVNIDSRAVSTQAVKTSIKCSKTTNTGIVKCLDYWDSINVEIPVITDVPAGYVLMSLGAVSYFVEVEFAGSILRYFYDAALNTITEQVNAGGKLATGARNAGKITLKVAQANNYRFDIDVGQTAWTGGGGTLKVKIYR